MSQLKILIAEDDKSIQALYRKALSPDLFDPVYAGNGRNALELYRSAKHDILILDIMLPEITGYNVLREVREKDKDTSTTIIMVTSLSNRNDIKDCQKIGIQGYIIKPFKHAEIGTRIVQYYQEARNNRAAAGS